MKKNKFIKTLKELEKLGVVKIKGEKVYRTKFGQKVYDYMKKRGELTPK